MDYEIYCQKDIRWRNKTLGFSKSTIGAYGCYITCLAMMLKKRPDEINEILKKNNAFYKDLLRSDKAAVALGLDYYGMEYNIDKVPNWYPNIKEVDYSPAPGKQQHFVLRILDNGKKKIVDPIDGKIKAINHYQLKSGKTGFVSYRLFKQRIANDKDYTQDFLDFISQRSGIQVGNKVNSSEYDQLRTWLDNF